MTRLIFIAGEFTRSFRKNLFQNLILIIIFSVGLVMTVIMSSYYMNLHERYPEDTINGSWYNVQINGDDFDYIAESLVTGEGCQRVMDYYEALRSMAGHPLMSINTAQSRYIKEQDVKRLFDGKNYERFLSENNKLPIPAMVKGESVCLFSFKVVTLDAGACQFYGIRTKEGEGFTAENMLLDKAGDAIPVILGSDYKGILEIGQVFDMNLFDDIYSCRVVGILERGSVIPEFGDYNADSITLDSYILFPYGIGLKTKNSDVNEVKKYADLAYEALACNSLVQTKEEEFNALMSAYREIGLLHDMPPLQLNAASMGLTLFRKESAARVRITLILTVSLVCFVGYSLFVTLYHKIQANSKTYGIYLMNGCTTGMITASYLMEIAAIIFPALFACRYVFAEKNAGMWINPTAIMAVVYRLVGAVFIMGAVFVRYMIKGVDTEHFMRQNE